MFQREKLVRPRDQDVALCRRESRVCGESLRGLWWPWLVSLEAVSLHGNALQPVRDSLAREAAV